MYGWIHESIHQLVIRKYGEEDWKKIVALGRFNLDTICIMDQYYADEETKRLVGSVANVAGISVDDVWESYGAFLITFTMENGWDEILRVLASDLKGFLDNLDSLHYFIDHTVFDAGLKGPSFRCRTGEDGLLYLHYYSQRNGLYPIVKGILREACRQIFNMEINIIVHERKAEYIQDTTGQGKDKLEEHVVFKITESTGKWGSITATIIHNGQTNLLELVKPVHPDIPPTFDSFLHFINSIFVFRLNMDLSAVARRNIDIQIKGAMVQLRDPRYMIFLCSPYVNTVKGLLERGLHLADLPLHDTNRDMIMLNQSRMSTVELNKKMDEALKELQSTTENLAKEKKKADDLLKEVLPESVSAQLREGKSVDACEFPSATIIFTDVPSFKSICALCTPIQVVDILNDLFVRFDRLIEINDVYKVETIGDSYMVVGGIPEQCDDHACRIANMAIGMMWECRSVISPVDNKPLQIRAGIHTGPVVAGVVGEKMPRYCLFGDTVNTASRMESHSVPMHIHLSSAAHGVLEATQSYTFVDRGIMDIKGKGKMNTYFLVKNLRQSVWELIQRQRGPNNTIDGYAELHNMSEAVGNAAINGKATDSHKVKPSSSPVPSPSIVGTKKLFCSSESGESSMCHIM